MKTNLIIFLTLICVTTYAGKIIRLGETNPKVRKIGESARNSHILKGSAAPKQKKTEIHKKDLIKEIIDAPLRKWTSKKGNSIKAQPIGLSSTLVVFEKKNGKKIKISRSKLVKSDQDYLNHYDETREFPPTYTKKNITITFLAASAILFFAIWFVRKPKKKYKAPKRNITIGTGL